MGLRDHIKYVTTVLRKRVGNSMPSPATYSNLENHPRLIRARQAKSVPKIQVDSKTGLPIVDGQRYSARGKQIVTIDEEDEDDDDRRKFPFSCLVRGTMFTAA